MKFTGPNQQYFEMEEVSKEKAQLIENFEPSELMLLWFDSDDNILEVDNIDYTLNKNDILCLTEFHKIKVKQLQSAKMIKWNKYFYCIINHDSEVGCKGVLYYGATQLPIIHLNTEEAEAVADIWSILEKEMMTEDSMQEEMLQSTLKRLLVLCTRIFKKQENITVEEPQISDIIREYHFLVETHFKELHNVADYAELLHKSPKTLSNIFNKLGSKSPLKFINERRILEARRLLANTNKTISEIGNELGFPDIQSFSRFFKRELGMAPNYYKEMTLGKNAN